MQCLKTFATLLILSVCCCADDVAIGPKSYTPTIGHSQLNATLASTAHAHEAPILPLKASDKVVISLWQNETSSLFDGDTYAFGTWPNRRLARRDEDSQETASDDLIEVEANKPWKALADNTFFARYAEQKYNNTWYFRVGGINPHNPTPSAVRGFGVRPNSIEARPGLSAWADLRRANLPAGHLPHLLDLPADVLRVIEKRVTETFSVFYLLSPDYLRKLTQTTHLDLMRNTGSDECTAYREVNRTLASVYLTPVQGAARLPSNPDRAQINRSSPDFVELFNLLNDPATNGMGVDGDIGSWREVMLLWSKDPNQFSPGRMCLYGAIKEVIILMKATRQKYFKFVRALSEWLDRKIKATGPSMCRRKGPSFGKAFYREAQRDFDATLASWREHLEMPLGVFRRRDSQGSQENPGHPYQQCNKNVSKWMGPVGTMSLSQFLKHHK